MEYVALKDVCKINMGQSPDSSSYNDKKEGIPFYQGNADFGEKHPIPRVWCNAPTKIAQPKDILMSVRAPIGALNYAQEKCCIGRGLAAITPDKDKLSLEFLYWFLREKNSELNSKGTGSTFKAISKKTLEEIRVPLIDLEKQQKMAQALEKTYAVIQMRTKQLKELDDLIKARFVEMFGDINVNDKSWNCEPLGGLCTIVRGGSPRPIEQFLGGDVPWIKIGDATDDDNIYLSSTKEHIIQEGVKKSRLVKSGSLIFANCGVSLGFARIITFDGCIHDGWLAMEDIDERLDKVFLLQALNQMTEHFRAIAPAGTQPNLNTTIMKAYKQVIPPIELQRDFIRFAKQVDKSKSHDPHLPIPPLKWYPLPKNEVPIMEEKIIAITNEMAEVLNIAQLKKLQEVLVKAFSTEEPERKPTNHEYLRLFLEAKSIEGCSPRTLQYYEVTVQHLFAAVNLPVRKMTTERMREYLSDYQQRRNCSKATIDNIRRNISSFFSWLEEEDHILKSPMRRIHKIKTKKTVKEVISDEDIEKLRDSCTSLRDLAMIDLLYSTGIRVGELVRLNIEDVNFESRECVVFGKGDKERRVYFDAKTKIHLKNYLESRRDTNRALFVSLLAPYNRLAISGVEIRLRKMGRMLNLKSIHPHKFRRTMATRAIDKGMPIEQVQKILGHSQIDTTMQYAIVNQNNVKMSHQKYIA